MFKKIRFFQAHRASYFILILCALIVLSPILALFVYAFSHSTAHWWHLLNYVLPEAFLNTAYLLFGVGISVILIGTSTAWIITVYDFPGKRILNWALLLPLAVPTYIVAFAYLDLWHPLGPIQSSIRFLLGLDNPRQLRLPDGRHLFSAIFVLGFVLYPYVYLSTRAMFMTQSSNFIEAARTLGANRWKLISTIILPLARPAIAVGLSLALLETLNDIGASEFLGVQTLTVSIYTSWTVRSDLAAAAQITLVILLLVVFFISLERFGRRHHRFSHSRAMNTLRSSKIKGIRAYLISGLIWLPVLIGFGFPFLYLLHQTYLHINPQIIQSLSHYLVNTVYLALLATILTVIFGLIIAWLGRQTHHRHSSFKTTCMRIASLGYAIPGTVLAIGLLIPASLLEKSFSFLFNAQHLWLIGTPSLLIFAYILRFSAISIGSFEAGLTRIPFSLEYVAQTLGKTPFQRFRYIHFPLLRPALISSALLIFVDTMKELPITLLLRPMNFETLATWLYSEAARGSYDEGAVAALAIVLSGLIPVILLARVYLKPNRS